MDKLGILRDADVFKNPKYNTPKKYEDRQTVKVIIQNDKKEIVLVTSPIHGLFLLPGGGADNNDLESEAKREALEETSHYVEIIKKVSETEDFRNRDARHYFTTCFFTRTTGKSDEDMRDEGEKEAGLETRWFKVDDALKIMSEQAEKASIKDVPFYNIAFNVPRDFYFLKSWIDDRS